jgi:hypothetical protein
MALGEHLGFCKLCGNPETPLYPSDKWEPCGERGKKSIKQTMLAPIAVSSNQSDSIYFLAHSPSSVYIPAMT